MSREYGDTLKYNIKSLNDGRMEWLLYKCVALLRAVWDASTTDTTLGTTCVLKKGISSWF